MFRRVSIVAALIAVAFLPALPADAAVRHAAKVAAPVGQQCPGGVPGVAQPGQLETVGPFNPNTGGYYNNQARNVTYCIPAGWQVLSENALPGNPTYAVRVGDIPWVSFTYSATGASTPHARSSWVLL